MRSDLFWGQILKDHGIIGKKLVQLIGMNSLKSLRYEIIYFYFRHNYVDLLINIMRFEYINKYTYWEIVWWMGCDLGWLDQDGSCNDI